MINVMDCVHKISIPLREYPIVECFDKILQASIAIENNKTFFLAIKFITSHVMIMKQFALKGAGNSELRTRENEK
jgi:hypothetical protein